jgi:hypothetical protein
MKIPLFALALLLVAAAGFAQTTADETAIKATIEQESASFHQRKLDKTLSYWANTPYVSHIYTEKGGGYVRGYSALSKAVKAFMVKYPTVDKDVYKNHAYQIHVNGTSAWATFITDVMDGGKKSQTYDARYLEKINGAWKLVSVVYVAAP